MMRDFDKLQIHLVNLSNPSINPIVSGVDPDVLDSLILDEYIELEQNGLAKFYTDSGYTGVIFIPNKINDAKAMILEIISDHANKLISEHETAIRLLRKYYTTFNNRD